MKDKRQTKQSKEPKHVTPMPGDILNNKEFVVQLLAMEASGNAKKHKREGPTEFVPFPYEEVTIANLVAASNKHFRNILPAGMTCEVMRNDRGPVCSRMSHLLKTDLINDKFGCSNSSCSRQQDVAGCLQSVSAAHIMNDADIPSTSAIPPPPKRRQLVSPIAIPPSKIMKLGKAITDTIAPKPPPVKALLSQFVLNKMKHQ